jgi:methanethiol S-methyltransferase
VLDAGLERQPRHTPLETTGVYGFVRHPVYLSWALFVFGAPHMTATRFMFAAISTIYIAVAIPFEERGLVEVFGEDYRTYQRKVRWRMVPGIY